MPLLPTVEGLFCLPRIGGVVITLLLTVCGLIFLLLPRSFRDADLFKKYSNSYYFIQQNFFKMIFQTFLIFLEAPQMLYVLRIIVYTYICDMNVGWAICTCVCNMSD